MLLKIEINFQKLKKKPLELQKNIPGKKDQKKF